MVELVDKRERFRGVMLGTLVGDALGLPAEGVSRRRSRRMFRGRWRHHFLFRRGMMSDDTEHTVFVAQSLLAHPDAPERFTRRLAWCLRLWLLGLPAGVGFATLRAVLRLWLGFVPTRSGVRSAGNGPSMRAAPIGATDAERIDNYVDRCTRITHTDARALTGARAVAFLVAWCVRDNLTQRPDVTEILTILSSVGSPQDDEWTMLLERLVSAWREDRSVERFADELGLVRGVSGYVYHTVPIVIYAWYKHFGNFEDTMSAVLNAGGDTDTTGAIAGALAGAVVGEQGIPADWVGGVVEWPRTTKILRAMADRLTEHSATHAPRDPVAYFWPAVPLRNVVFLAVVILHGLRRLLPPY